MTRGNQRDLARLKNQKKQQELAKANKKDKDGLTVEQRKFRDAEMMREKQKKKELEAQAKKEKNK
ncbi:putative SERF-like protein [Chrysoperla carnea]|uniref:putative SERF-like protein n=1 Tax=Chrysoperla carnea TaxID=189513 RepID=UPI001D071876|nr:putative SERF-like protein [Chrysoperla carnea]